MRRDTNSYLEEAVQYAEKHIQTKLSKGYEYLDKSKVQSDRTGHSLGSNGNSSNKVLRVGQGDETNGDDNKKILKRKIDEPLQRDDQKQTKKTEDKNPRGNNVIRNLIQVIA